MRTWQLYLDESGDFDKPKSPVLIAGVLFEGRATQQLSSGIRRRLDDIFVGSPYPPHAAHHNVPTSLLCGALADRDPQGGARERFLRGIAQPLEIARKAQSPAARGLRSEIAKLEQPWHRPSLTALRTFDAWLRSNSPQAYATLVQERDLQRADLARYAADELPGHLGHPPLVVASWQPEAGSLSTADARYERLYEVLLERVLAFVARRDDGAQLDVHLGARRLPVPQAHNERLAQAEQHATTSALLDRAKLPPKIIRYKPETYGTYVAPGIVLADFAANTLRSALFSATSWGSLASDVRSRTGLPVVAPSALLPLRVSLPSVAADGAARDAILRAARTANQAKPVPSLANEPRWAREQADAWIAAFLGASTS